MIYEPNSGVLRPELCISTQLQLAVQAGAQLCTNEAVQAVDPTSTGVVVTTNRSTYTADRVVIAAGSWVRGFLADRLATNVRTLRQVLYWFDMDPDAYEALRAGRFPVFVYQVGTDSHQMFYGFPAFDGPNGGLKVATEQYDVTSHPDHIERHVSEGEISAMYEQFASRIGGLLPTAVKTATCAYTVTSDWEYILDWAPESDGVFIASACTGRGFKHSAAVGETISQLLTRGSSDIDISSYEIGSRFG